MGISPPDKRSHLFADRQEAGHQLAAALMVRRTEVKATLGLTRGGVPVAYEVAVARGVPLDILVVKKLRAPSSEELAIGAICADGTRVVHPDAIQGLAVPKGYLAHEIEARLAEAQAAERRYRGELPSLSLAGKPVAIIDDGVATGATMEAAVLSVRRSGATRIMVAVPVCSEPACQVLRRAADEVFCLLEPAEFWAVGQFYRRFPQVSDEEVRQLLEAGRTAAYKVAPDAR